MIILLDTSTSLCKLTFIDGDKIHNSEWQAGRGLAKGLLSYIDKELFLFDKKWSEITAICVFKGPGSFTGLRIGITVMNTIADANNIPIVGGSGENWQNETISKLADGKNDKIVIPLYGSEPNITCANSTKKVTI
ncbi:MAG: tRNA threonylcarbamoyladenosine biosynthesis protein TsaB [Patescibacteria group bacterium]|nr:tRNA threonylcarbamoyladenosine biosynthesis protein TsaB [Patescibacteria group bacterium]